MAAEIHTHGLTGAMRQQLPPKQQGDGNDAQQKRNADKREFEKADGAVTGIERRLTHQHIHWRSGQGQFRTGMPGKNHRHEQL